jgi:integrase
VWGNGRHGDRIFKVITARGMSDKLNRIIRASGVDRVTAHGLRKYFNVRMMKAKV